MKNHNIAVVEWEDSSCGEGWHSVGADDGLAQCVTVGVVVRNNRKCITLVQSLASTGEQNNSFSIPRGCIASIKVVAQTEWPKKVKPVA
jgi:hypothetical protein